MQNLRNGCLGLQAWYHQHVVPQEMPLKTYLELTGNSKKYPSISQILDAELFDVAGDRGVFINVATNSTSCGNLVRLSSMLHSQS